MPTSRRYRADMTKRRSTALAIAYSAVVLAGGTAVSIASGDWIGLLCASGLVILPLGLFARGAVGSRR